MRSDPGGPTVLVVDNDPANRVLLTHLPERALRASSLS